MNTTPQEYAELIIKNVYKVENPYNLARAIGTVANKYAEWVIESISRMNWTTDGTDEHAEQHKPEQDEALMKREAYRLALVMLTDKLPK
jgi:hypothetical protein